jgi:Ca2+-transporting ATPase
VIINAVIGFLQEHRAERAVMALRSMTAPRARVMRDGHSHIITASSIVPGDLLVLEAGDIPAADARLRTAHALTTNEAPLTGESTPVEKTTAPTGPDTPLAERHDFVFMGTSVATGTGLAEVVATGMQTELGRIAHLLSTAEESVTPLQRRLARVSQTLLYICGGIVAIVPWLDCCVGGRSCKCSWPRSRWPSRPYRKDCLRSSRSHSRLAYSGWRRATC